MDSKIGPSTFYNTTGIDTEVAVDLDAIEEINIIAMEVAIFA